MKIYIASSVLTDYVKFLSDCIENGTQCEVKLIYAYDEVSYRKLACSYKLNKLYLRFGMYLIYPFILLKQLLNSTKEDICIITSNTFYAPLIGLVIKRIKKIKIVNLIYDLFPDALEVARGKSLGLILEKTLSQIAITQIKYCEATVFLGQHLKKYAELKYGKPQISAVIDVGADERLHEPRDIIFSDEVIHIHYGGQIGYMHDIDTLVAGIKACKNFISKVYFSFAISGAYYKEIEALLRDIPNCEVSQTVPSNQWRKNTLKFHVGLVSLSKLGMNICMPSKTYSMMAAYMAILAVCPINSDLAQLVIQNNCGWVVELGDIEGFVSVIDEIVNNSQKVVEYRKAARKTAIEKFGFQKTSEKWKNLLSQI